MSFIDQLTAFLPFGKKEEAQEYYFALNISSEELTAALWSIEGNQLKILETASDSYSEKSDLLPLTDKLLDAVLGIREIEPQKILFGVPENFLQDENLKEEYLKLLRSLVKDLELEPMAYVATSHAIVHFLEKQESVPTTAILVGFESHHLEVTVVRAGKLDGTKIVPRGGSSGADIEKTLLAFIDVETLPSKILIYGQKTEELEKLKSHLLSFSWMSKLSFLHFPKIEILEDGIEIKSICFAGASEIESGVVYTGQTISSVTKGVVTTLSKEEETSKPAATSVSESKQADLGFVVGDVADQIKEEEAQEVETTAPETEDFYEEEVSFKERINKWVKFPPSFSFKNTKLVVAALGFLLVLVLAYLFLPKAQVVIFVEPKVVEKDTQVTADPSLKSVNEDSKTIPGQIVAEEVSGSLKDKATGKKLIGDPARGTVVIRNKTDEAKTLSKGTILTSSTGFKYNLDLSVTIASRSAEDGTWGKATGNVTAVEIGPDSNLPSGSDLTVSSFPTSQLVGKAEGNFAGGTSKEVTVVSDTDQKRLLASLASDLRRVARQKLQEKLPGKKILEEALAEEILKKSYSKNINDQASEFSLEMRVRFKGTTFEEKDLKQIVGKLVTTQALEGFELDLADTETQVDISKLEKDGKLIFLARFKAKLLPKMDQAKIKAKIKGRTVNQVTDILRSYDSVLGSEIKITPSLPKVLQRLPILQRNIKIEVSLK